MKKSNHHELRALLRANPDGLTDVYRDRWIVEPTGRRPIAVFVAVQVPEDCPRPDIKSKRRSRGITEVVRREAPEQTES